MNMKSADTAGKSKLLQAASKMGAKPFIILFLVLLFLIPLNLVKSLIRDREYYRNEAVESILLPKGGEPVLEGFVTALPYTVTTEKKLSDGSVERTEKIRYMIAVPESWALRADVSPEYLTRGIFEVPVFSCSAVSEGSFAPAAYGYRNVSESDILWDQALLLLGVSNKKNLTSLPVVTANGTDLETALIAPEGVSPFSHTVFYRLPDDAARSGFAFTCDASVQGGGSLSAVPMAADNRFTVTSDWPTPGFFGGWLPTERHVSDGGFSAEWRIAGLSTVFPERWLSDAPHSVSSAESVRAGFVTPVDNYQKTMRSVKYAVLFLLIPFLTIFIFELFTGVRIHPVQYCLIGMADVVFYLLLLSVSEHVPFASTYWISSAAVCLLTLFYAASIFKKVKWGALFAGVQLVSYVFLFGTLQTEDYALLIGSLGLFCIVVLLMILTRKVDWYASSDNPELFR